MRNVPDGLFLIFVSCVLLAGAVRVTVYDGLRQTGAYESGKIVLKYKFLGETEVVDTNGRCEPIKILVGRVRSVDTFERCVMLCDKPDCRGRCVRLQPGYPALADRCVDRGDLSSCTFDRKAVSAKDCVVHLTLPEARVTLTVFDELHHTGKVRFAVRFARRLTSVLFDQKEPEKTVFYRSPEEGWKCSNLFQKSDSVTKGTNIETHFDEYCQLTKRDP